MLSFLFLSYLMLGSKGSLDLEFDIQVRGIELQHFGQDNMKEYTNFDTVAILIQDIG